VATDNSVEKNDVDKTSEMQNLLQEEYLKSLDEIEEGQVVSGVVVQINTEYVFVDVGYKSEGRIPITEFTEIPSVGETVSVVFVSKEGRGGQVVVSKKKADLKIRTENLRESYEKQEPVEGTFSKVIKGGFEIDLMYDLSGFCPLSKADLYRVENPEDYIGIKDYFIIDKLHTGMRMKSVLSRRAYLEKAISERKEKFFTTVQVGDTVEGTVKSFTSFGAFVDLGGFDGLLHINDMSWGHVTRPKDFVKKGDKIDLKVIHIDQETQKINLSLKHFTEDPWLSFEERYQLDDVVTGTVTKITDFGVFIELEEGIEGLAHISELSWVKRVSHPKEIVSIGDKVDAKILGYDTGEKKISLGLKQVADNPWDTIEDRFPIGKRMSAEVVKITNAGAFLNLEEGIDGFLHSDDISWTKKIKNIKSFCSEGDTIEVIVTRIEPENRRIRLGVKQLEGNPWHTLKDSYPKGSVITGEVTSVTEFGVFVKVIADIEGLIAKYNLVGPDEEFDDSVLARFKPGDKVTALVIDMNVNAQKLSLSIKDYFKKTQQKEISKYIHDDESEDTFTFADLMKEKDRDGDK
jgi:small subunit ribosomal protein S1